ncbi:Inter-alpha-trypsin inhibitor domain protein [Enhygromyxa salina]|uniref:Inter-alpha-trypsin inhibitor domain protein n=1 Tax=Enhygromyxa salina TaxID=215803 RepID=A0A0C2CZ15_9BACT|nr:Inter-alpha-trypsin inhibitor domain protein [Enhygromyxa salina]
MTGPRSLLLFTLTVVLGCASPNNASTPIAEDADASADAKNQAPGGAAEPDAIAPTAQPPEEPAAKPAAFNEEAEGEQAQREHGAEAFAPPADGASVRLEIQVPMINGGLNRDIIRRTASDHADDIRACHGRALAATPELAGTIVVALKIDADGGVSEAELSERSAFASRDVQDCVLTLARDWQFPKPSGTKPTSVELAFELGGS